MEKHMEHEIELRGTGHRDVRVLGSGVGSRVRAGVHQREMPWKRGGGGGGYEEIALGG